MSSSSDLYSPGQQPQPTRLVVFDEEGSPVRHPESPTKGKGTTKRIALGELTPGTIARRTRSAAKQPAARLPRENVQRSRPRLSPDKVGRHFTIKVDGGEEWAARDVRFVLWYYCRTVLKFDSIATAYNSTYPEAHNQMTAGEAEAIVETIKSNWARIKQDLEPGHFTFPEDWGWHPCDHLMICTSLQTGNRQTVMRNLRTRVAGVKLLKEILTSMWPGSWEELLQCPRTHNNLWEAELEQLRQSHHAGDRAFPVPPMVEENQLLDGLLDEISLGDDTDQSALNQEYDADNHQLHWAVRTIGGPKVLYGSIEVFFTAIFLSWILADWFQPLHPEKTDHVLLRISVLDLKSFMFMLYGAGYFTIDFLQIIKVQVRVFHGVDEPPPVSFVQAVRGFAIGLAAALAFAAWQGWYSSVDLFLVRFIGLNTAAWL